MRVGCAWGGAIFPIGIPAWRGGQCIVPPCHRHGLLSLCICLRVRRFSTVLGVTVGTFVLIFLSIVQIDLPLLALTQACKVPMAYLKEAEGFLAKLPSISLEGMEPLGPHGAPKEQMLTVETQGFKVPMTAYYYLMSDLKQAFMRTALFGCHRHHLDQLILLQCCLLLHSFSRCQGLNAIPLGQFVLESFDQAGTIS